MLRHFTAHNVEQRSEDWRRLRAGRVTGSAADALLAERKKGTGELAVRRNLRQKLVVERLTGIPVEDAAKGAAVQRGNDAEADAFRAYEARTGQLVKRSGFLEHTRLMAGASLDGYVGDYAGIVELKCPTSATHLDYLMAGTVPDDYRGQIFHNLYISGAAWCDFVSYDDRFIDPALRLFVVRVERDETQMKAYELMLTAFLSEVAAEVEKVQASLVVAA